MPTIRIDDEVWAWLKTHAKPLEDTPNTVLRRIAKLESDPSPLKSQLESKVNFAAIEEKKSIKISGTVRGKTSRRDTSGLTGQQLNREWGVGVHHPLYHKDGNYYNHLRYFPGALFDPEGYVVFKTEKEYLSSPYLQHGKQLHVPGGISSMPGYVRKK
jgi:hypothetical protein